MTTTNPERARRLADLWTRRPDLSAEAVADIVDTQLEAEQADEAERRGAADEQVDGFLALTRCQVCGENRGVGAVDGFCPSCRGVIAQLTAERHAVELVGGRSRRELAESFVAAHPRSS